MVGHEVLRNKALECNHILTGIKESLEQIKRLGAIVIDIRSYDYLVYVTAVVHECRFIGILEIGYRLSGREQTYAGLGYPPYVREACKESSDANRTVHGQGDGCSIRSL